MAETKKCPYCGEEILTVAKKCRYCGEWLDETNDAATSSEPEIQPVEQTSDEEVPDAASAEQIPIAEKLEKAIRNFADSHLPKSDLVFLLDQCTNEVLEGHKNYYANIGPDEKVLMVYEKLPINMIGKSRHGLVLTDRFLYYRIYPPRYNMFSKKITGVIPINSIKSIELGEDMYVGSSYVGHELFVNGVLLGLLMLRSFLSAKLYDELETIFNVFGS